MTKTLSFLLLTVLTLINVAVAETTATEKLDHFVQNVERLQAHFKQTVIDAQGNLMEEAEGTFQLQRPGMFRWDYAKPYLQQIVADGEQVWFYDVDLEQVTVKSQSEALAETPATLLSGEDVPQDKYLIRDLVSDDNLQWVELLPKEADSNFKSIILAFNGDLLQQMIMQDSFDQRTRLVFSQIQKNLMFKQGTFSFIPPAGVDVVGDSP